MPQKLSPTLPLQDKRALIASSAQKAAGLVAGLKQLGARVTSFPTIDIREIGDKIPIDAALDALENYAWIIFTSSYAVQFFLKRMNERQIPLERWKNSKVCAVGPATASTLTEAGIPVSLVPGEYVAEGVLRSLTEFHGGLEGLAGTRILFPRAQEARDLIPNTLSSAGALVDIVPCYENILPVVDPKLVRSIRQEYFDLVVFTSSSTVRNFAKLFGTKDAKSILERSTVAALGPITADTLASLGKKTAILPKENSVASLLNAIAEYFGR